MQAERNTQSREGTGSPAQSFADFTGKRALVTGGASGIGRAIASAFVRAGAAVEILDLNPETAAIAEDISGAGIGSARGHVADVRSRPELERVRAALEGEGATLDIVVPNAGINIRRPILELTTEQAEELIRTNLTGAIATMQVFVPMIVGRPGARVVATSSTAALHGTVLRGVYTATKAGLTGFVRSAAMEWGPLGITVNAVAPGIIRTPLTEAYMNQFPERAAAAMQHTALGRIGTPEEIADVVLFLASPAARFMTGQTVGVDGGWTAGSNWW